MGNKYEALARIHFAVERGDPQVVSKNAEAAEISPAETAGYRAEALTNRARHFRKAAGEAFRMMQFGLFLGDIMTAADASIQAFRERKKAVLLAKAHVKK